MTSGAASGESLRHRLRSGKIERSDIDHYAQGRGSAGVFVVKCSWAGVVPLTAMGAWLRYR